MKKIIIILSILSTVYSQQWTRFVNWNDGNCLIAEDDSILWVGTKAGLVKWNISSNNYTTFDHQDGLPSTAINDLIFDNNKTLWMATNNGIVSYDKNTFKLYNYKNIPTLPKARFIKIIADTNNNIYAATGSYIYNGHYNHGSFVTFIDGQWKVYHGYNHDFSRHITDMIFYHDSLLIALPNQGPDWDTHFYTVINKEFTKIKGMNIPTHGVNFTIDYEDSLWLGSGRFLYKYRNHSWIVIIDGNREEIGSLWQYAWSNGKDGIWLGGYPWFYYLNIEKNRKGIRYRYNLPPGVKKVNDFAFGFRDNIELNGENYFVSQMGLSKIINNKLHNYQIPKTIDHNKVHGLGVSPNNDILISGPISTQKFDGSTWTSIGDIYTGQRSWNNNFRYSHDGELFTNHNKLYPTGDSYSGFVTGLDFDGKGNLWITSPISRFTGSSYPLKTFSLEEMGITPPPFPQLTDIYVDKYEHVWFAGSNNIVMYDGTKWHTYSANDVGIPFLNLDYVFADSKGRKWFSDYNVTPNWGLIMYDDKQWSVFNFPSLNRGQYIYQIAEDHLGNLWFASKAGLLKYDNSRWFIYNFETENVDFNSTTAVTVDQRGNIWVGTSIGLYVYNPYGIDFTTDITPSPIVSLKIIKENGNAIARFIPNSTVSNIVKYELQRGIKHHKFWTVSSITSTFNNTDSVKIIDSTLNIGAKVYRIKAIDGQGRAFYSKFVRYQGDIAGANIHNFIAKKENDELLFEWVSEKENHVAYYEIFEKDTVKQSILLLKKIKAHNSKESFTYRISGKKLSSHFYELQYTLNAVYDDSTRSKTLSLLFSPSLPETFEISHNYPNPFNNTTHIRINNPLKQTIKIEIYNLLGQKLFIALEKEFDAGYHTIPISFSRYASGIYIYKVSVGKEFKIGKMILIK